ncbi:ABC transporter permease [Bacillus sp. ISL-47]|uniref:ABC transporter permease n=1 Tax=Bacillus sp. ISL-47 TaxID=2819130 RepID=UPI001BED1E4C|nr:ABC transporter permease [Bacillus sp. ISL-47]MBT2690506.1 ABC transporter permease [Bacillus sp. ISL-47]MBT2709412.1 ABC transporter permease [Pseudomonas sp. ISL-84]
MRSVDIFFSRLISSWKYQYGVFRSIADWTIWLYILLPGTAILVMMYRSWWTETPDWIANLPLFLLFFLLYLFSWLGNVRLFVQEADKAFLFKNRSLYLGMRKWGLGYSFLLQAISTAALILLLLPFLINRYFLEWSQITALLVFFLILKWTIMTVSYQMKRIENKFKKYVLGFLLFVLFSWFSQLVYFLWDLGEVLPVYITSAVLLAGTLARIFQLLNRVSAIDFEVKLDQKVKTKYIQWIFMMAPEIEKPAFSIRSKPLFFRKSKRLFKKRTPVTGLIELFLKIFIRNPSYIISYFQIISISAAGIMIIPPLWIKAIVLGIFLFLAYSWLSITWDKAIMSHPFTKKYREKEFYYSARKKTVWGLFLLAIMLLGLVLACWLIVLSKFGILGGFGS